MNDAPCHEIAKHLDAESVAVLGASSGWGLYAQREPATPNDVVTVYDTGGSAPALFDEDLRLPTIQVRVRSDNYDSAYGKQKEIFDVLTTIKGQDIEGSHYIGVWMTSDVLSLGPDDNGRYILTANYQIERGPIS